MFAFGKNKQLMAMLDQYLNVASETMDMYSETFGYLLQNGFDRRFEVLVQKTKQSESNADDMLRQIKMEAYSKSLLPETREDILTIIEVIDQVPSKGRRITIMLSAQQTRPPDTFDKEFIELLRLTRESFDWLVQATRSCLGMSSASIQDLARKIDNDESLGDRLERDMISRIFATDAPVGEKLLQRDIVEKCGSLIDMCEKAMDRVMILKIKRHI